MSRYSVIGVARNLCWRRLRSEAPKAPRSRRRSRRGGEGTERGAPFPSRLWGLGERRKLPSGVRGTKRVLEYLELEKTHRIATNLSYLTFLLHILSHIHIHNY